MKEKVKIVILGGGYAGLLTAVTLQNKVHAKRADITLINKQDYHYLTTKIHESAAGALNPELIHLPISDLIDTERIHLVKDVVLKIDLMKKEVILKKCSERYDYLVAAIGGAPRTFNIPGLKENGHFIFDFEGTERLREQIKNQFIKYNADQDESRLTFVIGGAGFTGIEFLFEFLEQIPKMCKKYGIEEEKVKVICAESATTLLNGYDSRMAQDAWKSMQKLKCKVLGGLAISSCSKKEVLFSDGKTVKTNTIIWAGGIKGNPILENLGFPMLDGRVIVNEYLEVEGHKEIYILGDASVIFSPEGEPYPPSAQIALQQGQYCGKNIALKVYGQPIKPFNYIYRGAVMSLGRKNATGVVYGNYINGKLASFIKYVIEMRYYYMLGGLRMLAKEMKRERLIIKNHSKDTIPKN
ncbi:NAD(P)/FAD-dependent oxidoreductase [Neobacillus terrae]|uniref:NAD(P)/FAD-dependent oxidoreductase n=1 Tax=Neobacillus terrae TaxID=3034837 RepID=UPI0014072F68|nr:NAD(P)/FAD-dependent oxidoreductase [Neobacillus terrae]NHM33769.1 NAD(P)/FAD-dependent oxidoreductase [Neobacillus terrae]